MRASRLVAIMLLLQSRGQMTAPALAEELEVSVRTIYRDLEALSESGVPVYAETGPSGGYRLIDGYQTRLTGLDGAEAEALLLAGVPGPLGALGLGSALVGGQRKLEAALPDELRARAAKARQRFHVDLSGWFQSQVVPPLLGVVATAVWEERRLRIDYRPRDGQPGEREIDPLGLVVKAGTWYLIASAPNGMRTYRVSRVVGVTVLDEPCRRPKGFDLESFWTSHLSEYEASLPAFVVQVRAAPEAVDALRGRVDHRSLPTTDWDGRPDQGGWRRLSLTFETLEDATAAALELGDQVEILRPEGLRSSVTRTVAALARLYGRSTSNHVTLEVRAVKAEEYELAGQLVVAAYQALPGNHMTGGYAAELADVARRATETEVLVAVDGDLLGCVTFVPDASSRWAEMLEDDEAGIRMLAVDPTIQGRGVGQALLDACIERARQLGRSGVFLHSTPWMTAAHRLYLRSGFDRDSARDWMPVPEVPLLAFRLDLSAS